MPYSLSGGQGDHLRPPLGVCGQGTPCNNLPSDAAMLSTLCSLKNRLVLRWVLMPSAQPENPAVLKHLSRLCPLQREGQDNSIEPAQAATLRSLCWQACHCPVACPPGGHAPVALALSQGAPAGGMGVDTVLAREIQGASSG